MSGPDPREDADLVRGSRDGDDEAYTVLVRRYQHLLYRHARGMGLDHDTALDMVQDALVKAYMRLEDCREPEHFRAWLFRICRNLCLDHLKNIRRKAVSLDAMEEEPEVRMAPDPTTRDMLRRALGALSTELREAFLLKHDAGYTYDEVARLLGVSESAVKMRVHRARASLVRSLSGERAESDAVCDDLQVPSRLESEHIERIRTR